MSITVIIELRIKPDKLKAVRPLFATLLGETRMRDGNEGVTVQQEVDCPTSIILLEKWQNKNLYETYTHWRAQKGDFERLSELLERPLNRRFLEHVPV